MEKMGNPTIKKSANQIFHRKKNRVNRSFANKIFTQIFFPEISPLGQILEGKNFYLPAVETHKSTLLD
jgi:hypothetical protein